MAQACLHLHVHGDLKDLLHPRYRKQGEVKYHLRRRASIKDIIESLRIPHTEIGRIVAVDREHPFAWIPQQETDIHLHPLTAGYNSSIPSLLRPIPVSGTTFLVDVNVGKLATLLRMAGLDTSYAPLLTDEKRARTAAAEGRILLSRNRDLLKRSLVMHGHLVRSEIPEQQLTEVLTLYGLQNRTAPFTRCLRCNTILQQVEKAAILHLLEPLTRKYYQRFSICPDCGRIYWQGSHHQRMKQLISSLS